VSAAAHCRFCGASLDKLVVDLGEMPLANAYIAEENISRPEPRFPLRVFVCGVCFLVQTDADIPPGDIFSDYAYFSSYSQGWLDHARHYCETMTARFGLTAASRVIEVASNDGYLLKDFVAAGIPTLGIEPARNVAEVARAAGVPTQSLFLTEETGRRIAREFGPADLVVANNVLAHVPAINDFVEGLRRLLADHGVLTIEFPHLAELIVHAQFDTIYHEHFSYLSLAAVERILAAHDLRLFDGERLPTHGGSLRLYAEPRTSSSRPESERLAQIRAAEHSAGVTRMDYYDGFSRKVASVIAGLRSFLKRARGENRTIIAYGAAAKGNTLLNACGATAADIACVVDRNPHKQGHYLPGSRLPIRAPAAIDAARPDYVLILPWNLKAEIMAQTKHISAWGGRFVVPSPELTVLDP
jgi:SAM-dependent methyltransferase